MLVYNYDYMILWIKDRSVKENPNLVKNEMNSLLMMSMGFDYTSIVLQNYVHLNVRSCIMDVL